MTYEEALNFNQKWTEEQAFNDLERYLLREEPPAMKAVAICMRATKKQMPKKAIHDSHMFAICPTCGGSVSLENVMGHMINGETSYCEHCGQALDWSKEK